MNAPALHHTIAEPVGPTVFGLVCSCGYETIGTADHVQSVRVGHIVGRAR